MSRVPRIAVVGRPNVGKSTLFNRLAGRKIAIVSDEPGVTRDRREVPAKISDMDTILVDTAGFENVDGERLEARMRAQTERAVAESDLCLFVYDARAGVIPLDEIFAGLVRKSGTPYILVANKCESRASDDGLNEAWNLGLGEAFAVSSEHNVGVALLEVEISDRLHGLGFGNELDEFAEDDDEDDPDRPLKIAVIGRPNAGKSTLINKLIEDDRLVTGPEAGVTRDSIEIPWEWNGKPVLLYDTAGMRKRARIDDTLEKLSVGDSLNAIKFAEVVVMLMDAEIALDKQDLQLADLAVREGRALVLAVNKWDIVSNKSEAAKGLRTRVAEMLPQVRGVPLVLISSLTGRGLDDLYNAITSVYENWTAKVKTRDLNDWLREMTQKHPPPAVNGRRIRPKYMTQTKARPPTFVLMCSRADKLPDSYKRYLINGLREDFGFPAVPIRLHIRAGRNPYDPET